MTNPLSIALFGLVIVLPAVAGATHRGAAAAIRVAPPPDLTARVRVDANLGSRVPLELWFRRADGMALRLGQAVSGKPAVLVPGYYSCTNLCAVLRAGVAQAVSTSGLRPGAQFDIVVFSIDPQDSAADAAAAQRADASAHPAAHVEAWHYLVGTRAASAALAEAIGFRYLFDARNRQYAHPAALAVLSPEGLITQYLPGVHFSPLTLRLAIVNASRGRVGSLIDRLVLLCCAYDSSTGRYSLLIDRALQTLGLITVGLLVTLIVALRRAERRARARGLA